MVDYVHINRLSTVNRLENITKEIRKEIEEKLESCKVTSGEIEEVKIGREKIETLDKFINQIKKSAILRKNFLKLRNKLILLRKEI